jgi:cell wall-associated NlpC family hydrolase
MLSIPARLSHLRGASPHRSGSILLLACATVSGLPSTATAQSSIVSPFQLETFGARNETRSSNTFGGVSLTGYSGVFGFRVNGAVAGLELGSDDRFVNVPYSSCSPRFGCRNGVRRQYANNSTSVFSSDAWTADADLLMEPFRKAPLVRQLLLGFSPYAFSGIGRVSTDGRTSLGGDITRAVWSYGAGVHHDLVSRAGVTAEARIRRSLDNNSFIGSTFRDALQYRVGLNFGLGGGARRTKSVPATIRPVTREPAPRPVVVPSLPSSSELASAAAVPRLIDAAEGLLGSAWREGGTSPATGFDAGGFVQYLFAQEGIALPRMVRELAVAGMSVSARVGSLRPGDLLFFGRDGLNADHVGMYVGRERFVHASASGGGVLYDVLGEGPRGEWFASNLLSVRRVLGSTRLQSVPASPSVTPSGRPDTAPKPAGAR